MRSAGKGIESRKRNEVSVTHSMLLRYAASSDWGVG